MRAARAGVCAASFVLYETWASAFRFVLVVGDFALAIIVDGEGKATRAAAMCCMLRSFLFFVLYATWASVLRLLFRVCMVVVIDLQFRLVVAEFALAIIVDGERKATRAAASPAA